MNVFLTAEEILHAFETLVKNPYDNESDQESLLQKFRSPILSALEKEHDRIENSLYQAWTEKEEKRIKDLVVENNSIKPRVAVGRGRK